VTWVKFCGMRSVADVAAAAAAGADAVGFVTAAGSVRQVSVAEAEALGAGVALERYLVTQDEQPDDLIKAAQEAAVTGVQPHGRFRLAAAEAALKAGLQVLYPVSADDPGHEVPEGSVPIIDGAVPGSGTLVDLSLASKVAAPFVIAGGLTPTNVGDICARLAPYGVDVSSGIEIERGMKDPELMIAFMRALR
jgi:phosphoribosylanthranilate isomerase